ncbi:MAG TPA: HypC/HybG/HupF family hydrogenase formation chaperone [Chitinophagaceae bacterium]|nr:HypC/HybG/HupF family hydrogenase formation chaperone [Chitinophagaceae bacterium]
MCLAIPGKILSIQTEPGTSNKIARVSFGGIVKEASLEIVPEAEVDDYVLVHVGVAISKVNVEEAEKVYQFLHDMGDLNELTEN